jgi:hypothetical protein
MHFDLARKVGEEGKLDRDGLPCCSLDGLHITIVCPLKRVRCIVRFADEDMSLPRIIRDSSRIRSQIGLATPVLWQQVLIQHPQFSLHPRLHCTT